MSRPGCPQKTLLHEHIQANSLGRDDLLFAMPIAEAETDAVGTADTPPPDHAELGRTDPNKDGRTYPHGTITAYNLGRCRCDHCRCRVRPLPRPTARRRQRRPPQQRPRTTHQHRRTHPPPLVRPTHLETRRHRRRTRLQRPRARPTPRPRLLAARRRRRHPNRERTPRPRQPAHHREIPAHPARHQRDRPGRAPPHPQPADRVTDNRAQWTSVTLSRVLIGVRFWPSCRSAIMTR